MSDYKPRYTHNNCQLCGSDKKVQVYCGGPVAFMCDRCKKIVHKWEDLKKRRDEWAKEARIEMGMRLFFKHIDLEEIHLAEEQENG